MADTEMSFEAVPEPSKKELTNAGYLELDQETKELQRNWKHLHTQKPKIVFVQPQVSYLRLRWT